VTNLVPCQACGRQVSTAAKQCMNCGHPIKSAHSYTWLLTLLVIGTLAVIAIGLYRVLPVIQQTMFSAASPIQSREESFGVASLPQSNTAVSSLPPGGRQPTKRELSQAARKLDSAAAPYWNHVYKIDRIYYYPTDHVLNIDYLVRDEFEEVNKSMLRETHRKTFCSAAAYSIFRFGGVMPQWSFRADSDNELLYTFKISSC